MPGKGKNLWEELLEAAVIPSAQQVGLQGSGSRWNFHPSPPPGMEKPGNFLGISKPSKESQERMEQGIKMWILGSWRGGNNLKYSNIPAASLGLGKEEKGKFGDFERNPEGNSAAQGLNYSRNFLDTKTRE